MPSLMRMVDGMRGVGLFKINGPKNSSSPNSLFRSRVNMLTGKAMREKEWLRDLMRFGFDLLQTQDVGLQTHPPTQTHF